MRRIVLSLAVLGALGGAPLTAHAQNVRSWVASTGLDGNPCTRAQPCASFNRALSQTNAGGEINCVDQGDFGNGVQLGINKAITIDCDGVGGHIEFATAEAAIGVTASPTDVVVIRGLDIDGAGTGGTGITVISGDVHIDNCLIHGFKSSTLGFGVAVAAGAVSVSDTVLIDNGTSSSGAGLVAELISSDTIIKLILNRVEVRSNFFGIKADGTIANGGVIQMTIRDSVSTGNGANGIVGTGLPGGPAILMMIDRSSSSHNTAGFGIIADGPKTTIRLGGSSITGNINGVGVSNGGAIQSYGTNQINGNSNDGIASLTPIGLH